MTSLLPRTTYCGLLAAAAVCGSTVALGPVRGPWRTPLEQDRLDSVLAGGNTGRATLWAPATARLRAEARPGQAWGRFEVPRLGVSTLVAEGIDESTLDVAVGHLPGSAFPGEVGNVGLTGHRGTLLRVLDEVWPADIVLITTSDGVFEYRVEWLAILDPAEVDVDAPKDESILTLVTSYPFDYVGRAPLRYVVRARSVEPPARPAPDV